MNSNDLTEFFTTTPDPTWFYRQPPSQIHGLAHIARVMVWSLALSLQTPWGEHALWAAACHDLCRHNDRRDLKHGARAGQWVRQNLSSYHPCDSEFVQIVASACQWHVVSDAATQWSHPVLWLLKDADGLDRVRLDDLNPAYLRCDKARELVGPAQLLFDQTRHFATPIEVWQKALIIHPPLQQIKI